MKKIAKKLKTKSDIVSQIAVEKNLPFSSVALAIDTIFEEIIQSLLRDQKAELRGFGTFGVKKYKSYKGRNPKNQEKVVVPSKRRPWFKPGIFRESLNQK